MSLKTHPFLLIKIPKLRLHLFGKTAINNSCILRNIDKVFAAISVGVGRVILLKYNLMLGQTPVQDNLVPGTVHEEWRWTHLTFVFETTRKLLHLKQVQIDLAGATTPHFVVRER
jgi:hypothetical protein